MPTKPKRFANGQPVLPCQLLPQTSPCFLPMKDDWVWVGRANPSLDSLLLRKIVLKHRQNLRSFAVGRGFALGGSATSTPSRFFLMMSPYSSPLFLTSERRSAQVGSEPPRLRPLGMEILASGSCSRIASSTSKSTIVAAPAFRNKPGFAAASS